MLSALSAQAFAAFSLALLGGLHCAGMCGGLIGALQLHRPLQITATKFAFAYHAGRITSYVCAGASLGLLGAQLFAAEVLPVQVALLIAGGLMLLLIGASMFGKGAWLKRLEPIGLSVWRLIGPHARKFFPPRTAQQAFVAGLAWGWIPCGMVYAALPLAMLAGGVWQGAAVMLAFGIGTLPNLVAVDVAVVRFGTMQRSAGVRAWLRPLAGVAILAFGVSGLAHAARVAGAQHPAVEVLASLCHRS